MDAELKRKRLATSIVEYLDKAISENLVSSDGAESLEVAKQCIVDAFELDETSTELSIKPITLDRVFDVYLSTQDKLSSTKKADAAAPAAPTGPSEDDKKRAEALKAEGNALVVQKSFPAAIAKYTEAIAIVDDNAVYYGNRAAAHSQTGDHASAVADAKKALEVDPAYSKGYSRLGLAYYGLGEYKEAVEAYTKGLELDPGNRFMQDSLAAAKGKLSEDDAVETVERSTGGAGASGAGGAGGFDMA
ncbi:Small glutamine-rich tetratricopeptide repeat-containing protein 2, partial [Linderina macrospora]